MGLFKVQSLENMAPNILRRKIPSFSREETSLEAAPLGDGVTWALRPDSVTSSGDPAWSSSVADFMTKVALLQGGEKVTPDAIFQAMRSPREQIDEVEDGSVCVYEPEGLEELDYCKWDGDGHFDVSRYCGSDPPTLGQVIVYVRMVEKARNTSAATLLIHTQAFRAKAAVLAGAFLVLAKEYTADDAWKVIVESVRRPNSDPEEAWDRFSSPFAVKRQTTSTSLTVLDCLKGLEKARDLGWLHDFRTFDLLGWRLLRKKLDASWIIPGEVLALGDPAFTVDNPAFPELTNFEHPCQAADLDWQNNSRSSSKAADLDWQDNSGSSYKDGDCRGTPSTCTPKTPGQVSFCSSLDEVLLRLDNFASYFERMQIRWLVRLNFAHEGGGNLKPDPLLGCDVERIHHEFKDCDIPPPKVLQDFLEDSDHARERLTKEGGAIAVHCKAGLGRTAVVIGAYAARHYDFDGGAFHGWVRMARPGSVQFPKQENFLRTMKVGGIQRKQSKSMLTKGMGFACLPGSTVSV